MVSLSARQTDPFFDLFRLTKTCSFEHWFLADLTPLKPTCKSYGLPPETMIILLLIVIFSLMRLGTV